MLWMGQIASGVRDKLAKLEQLSPRLSYDRITPPVAKYNSLEYIEAWMEILVYARGLGLSKSYGPWRVAPQITALCAPGSTIGARVESNYTNVPPKPRV